MSALAERAESRLTHVAQKRAALYARVSSKKQEREGTSLATQEALQRAYCAEHGYTIDEQHVYVEVHTAEDLWQRPKLTALREAARAHQFDVVVMHATDRFSRKQAHTFIIADELERLGIPLEFVTEQFDDTAVGRFMHSAKAFAAEVEMEKLRERTGRGLRARVDAGKPLHSRTLRYGYQWADEAHTRYDADPRTAPIVQRVFAAAARGQTLRRLAAELTKDGVPTARGAAEWDMATISRILREPAYTGRAFAFRTKSVKEGGKRRTVNLPPEQWVALPDGAVPALVDEATFAAVQARLATNKERAARRNAHPEATLLRGGYVRCGYCERAMHTHHGHSDGYPMVIYRCDRSRADASSRCQHGISAAILDTAVWQRLRGVLLHPEHLAAELERMQRDDPSTADLAAVEHALTSAKREQRTWLENLGKVTGAAADMVAGKVNALETQCQQLTAERETILARSSTWTQAREKIADLQAWCRAYAQSIDELTYEQRRLALDGLGVSVKVWRASHTDESGTPLRYKISASIPLDPSIVLPAARGSQHNRILLTWTDRDPLPAHQPRPPASWPGRPGRQVPPRLLRKRASRKVPMS